jgi:hypothetical protein
MGKLAQFDKLGIPVLDENVRHDDENETVCKLHTTRMDKKF